MNDFLETMDKINTISFIVAILVSVVVIIYLAITMKYDSKKKNIMINKNKEIRK